MSDLVEKVKEAIALEAKKQSMESSAYAGDIYSDCKLVLDGHFNIDGFSLAALAAIHSLSFDEAVEIGYKAALSEVRNNKNCKRDIMDAIRALTANGDVLIRAESTYESPDQNVKAPGAQ